MKEFAVSPIPPETIFRIKGVNCNYKLNEYYQVLKTREDNIEDWQSSIYNYEKILSLYEKNCIIIKPLLSEKEKITLEFLKEYGFEWLCAERDGCLFAWKQKPYKELRYWDSPSKYYQLPEKNDTIFNFICWEDAEPVNIEDLLEH